jgi:zinc and cadmium transporter
MSRDVVALEARDVHGVRVAGIASKVDDGWRILLYALAAEDTETAGRYEFRVKLKIGIDAAITEWRLDRDHGCRWRGVCFGSAVTLVWILLAAVAGSAGSTALSSLSMLATAAWRERLLPILVSYATGTLLGAAFLSLLPHALESLSPAAVGWTALGGVLGFFALEKLVILRHCHERDCDLHRAAGVLLLIGDAFHNFVDGVVMAAGFLTSPAVGLSTAVAAVSHEVPQEVGDFAILVHSGMTRRRALALNLLSSAATLPGALLGYFLLDRMMQGVPYLLAVAAASFLYIAMADLVPHLQRERKGWSQILAVAAGVLTIVAAERLHHG